MAVSFNCPWVLRACRGAGRRGVYSPLAGGSPYAPTRRRETTLPRPIGQGITRIRNDSAGCRRTKTHGGEGADQSTGCWTPMAAITWSDASSPVKILGSRFLDSPGSSRNLKRIFRSIEPVWAKVRQDTVD